MFLFICLARVKCCSLQCAGLFEWTIIQDVTLNTEQLQRLSPEMESYYVLDNCLRDGTNSLVITLKEAQREHKHVRIATSVVLAAF